MVPYLMLPYVVTAYFLAGVSTTFHIRAASAAPISGPTMNIHRLVRAVPPSNSAGPMLRAGFTDVPV